MPEPFTYQATATYTFPGDVESTTLDALSEAIDQGLHALGLAAGATESSVSVTLEAEAEPGPASA